MHFPFSILRFPFVSFSFNSNKGQDTVKELFHGSVPLGFLGLGLGSQNMFATKGKNKV